MSAETKTTEEIEKAEKAKRLTAKLDRFLARACNAEKKLNYFRAGRFFALALLCEGLLRTDGKGGYTYVLAAMPAY